jgi:CubicO group peptidase (beta-lactamase class C family)
MKKISVAIFISSFFSIQAQSIYQTPALINDGISIGTLESIRIDSDKILALTKLILADSFPNIHSVLIFKDSALVYENYFAGKDQINGKKLGVINHTREDLHDCRSITKSVVSACIGIAIDQGLIKNVDDPIFNYLSDYSNLKNVNNEKLTIRHLLTMSSGTKWNEQISYASLRNSETRMNLSRRPVRYILTRPIVATAGSRWNYNGGDTQLLAEIIKTASGKSVDKFAEENLFKPLGIKKYTWLPLFRKHSIPAASAGLRMTSRDFLKLGLLYLNDGKWNDRQILSPEWVKQSTTRQIWRDEAQGKGYGYQFWTYTDIINDYNYDITEAKGNGGNAIFISKSERLVVVITAGNYNQWSIVNNSHQVLVKFIIPAMQQTLQQAEAK